MRAKAQGDWMIDFRQRCQEAGLAVTHQRAVIYREITESRNHPSPESIYERVRSEIPSLSLATVYKNIHAFLEAGLLREVSPFHGALRLEGTMEDHHHLVCTRCKEIVDIEPEDLAPVELRRPMPAGFKVLRYAVEFQGVCPACSGGLKES
jgi:Fur family peroxide stress response transcriptional regulator